MRFAMAIEETVESAAGVSVSGTASLVGRKRPQGEPRQDRPYQFRSNLVRHGSPIYGTKKRPEPRKAGRSNRASSSVVADEHIIHFDGLGNSIHLIYGFLLHH
jgi:hypothetical protein